ncbi:DUF305 domain-containing protein [Dactylosporangium sp. AC04546]|uniref:DUF305 domain-containing protein n=1 Tax=Dactylosporangium sp. AC04546 TaxID=2862460 RepID=UPI001EDF58AB|nr:DUF305 domain-containing protein [Dactylosporangium sp. AC04546]WVK86036.1 DUF305 domain-containing protein [Dactylosporangium sp. AC04546]
MRRLLIIALALALSGCGQVAKSPTGTSELAVAPAGIPVTADGPHNDADVMFLQMMISHQKQGLEMIRLGRTKAVREDVVNLAGAIDVVEAEEVEMMQRWLTGWNVPVTGATDPGIHASHGGRPATGPEEIKALQDATGADFETKFLNLLIAHQHNAVEMAQQLGGAGQNAAVKDYAKRVELSRTQQIKQMLALVGA